MWVFTEPFNFSFFGIFGWGIDLDYCDTEWLGLEMNRDHSVIFEIVFWTLLLNIRTTNPFLLMNSCTSVVDVMVI